MKTFKTITAIGSLLEGTVWCLFSIEHIHTHKHSHTHSLSIQEMLRIAFVELQPTTYRDRMPQWLDYLSYSTP